MNRFLSVFAISALLAAPAMAADMRMPVKAPPPVVEAVYNWTGFYVGIHGGYKWADHRIARLDAAGAVRVIGGIPLDDTHDARGALFGGHAGFNYQVNRIVFGVEGDFDWADANYERGTVAAGPADFNYGKISRQASIRGRLGFAIFDRTLIYGTGGVAWAKIFSQVDVGGTPFIAYTKTVAGWTAGGGIEYAFHSNFSIRAEYRYVDYNDIRQPGTAATATFLTETKEHSVRAGLTWRFSGAPLVARY
jgi:outer membrane immunogenic protein